VVGLQIEISRVKTIGEAGLGTVVDWNALC